MRANTALGVYVSLFLATTARGDLNWKDVHDYALQAFEARQLEVAEPLFRKSVEVAKRPTEIATSSNDLGVLLHTRGRDVEAKQWLTRAVVQWKQIKDYDAAARSGHSLGTVNRAIGDYPEAEKATRDAIALHSDVALTIAMLHNLLGDLLREQGRLTEAREAAEVALQIHALPWRTTADSEVIIADVERETGQYSRSIVRWSRLLEQARTRSDAIGEAVALRGLGETQLVAGDRASAEPSLRKSLAMFEATNSSHQIASTLTCLGELYISELKPAMAEEAFRRAVDLDEKAIGPTHPQIAVLLQMRADAASRQGAAPRARADLDRAGVILAGRFGEKSPVMGAYLANRGIIEERAGNYEDAAIHFERATGILRTAGPESRSVTATLLQHYAAVLRNLHRKGEAKEVLAEAKSFHE